MDLRVCARRKTTVHRAGSKTNQIQRNLFVEEAIRSSWSDASSAKLVMWWLFYFSVIERSILSGTPQFVCLKYSVKFGKRTLFTPSMQALTHRLKSASLWPSKTSNWWIVRRTALTWQWHSRTSFCFIISRKKAWWTIVVTRKCCWSVQKPCFVHLSIRVDKHQNILSTVMLESIKLSYGKVRLILAIPETYRPSLVCCIL